MTRNQKIQVYSPIISLADKRAVAATARTGWVSSLSPEVRLFERRIAEFVGSAEGVATMNGTTAIHLALAGLGIGPGDEVIVPALTFIAAAAAIRYTGATPVFADVSREDWNISVETISRCRTRRTRALVAVHTYGNPADIPAMKRLLGDSHIVEDAAEAFGASVGDRQVGSMGAAGAFSFYGNKIITTGEGGMVVTNNRKLARRLRVLRDHAMDPKRRYYHREIGWNYRMTALQASLGNSQLDRAAEIIRKKRRLAVEYAARLGNLSAISLHVELPSDRVGVYWMYSILTRRASDRNKLMAFLATRGIDTRPFFVPLPTLPPFRDPAASKKYPVSCDLAARGINLPSGAGLRDADLDRIAEAVRDYFRSAAVTRPRRRRQSTRGQASS